MCGILAAFSNDRVIDEAKFSFARDTLAHRGPDGAGTEILSGGLCALGHRRLSIIDLSEAGRQPMQLGHLWVVYNGEIYNYPALKSELEDKGFDFRTNCDTEVLLHGYQAWGKGLCDRLEGMFAFAIWDDREQSFFCGRDSFGQKPLYHAEHEGIFYIASEIKAIKALAGHSFPMRRESFYEFLVYDYVPSPSTWFEGIYELPPGHRMEVGVLDGRFDLNVTRYWNFELDPDPPPVSKHTAIETLLAGISESVDAHLLADVEVGAFLSGGVDSNCVCYEAARKLDRPLRTFCVGFDEKEGDERIFASQSAKSIRADHYEELVQPANIEGALGRSLTLFDQPFGDPSQLPTWSIAKVAASHVKVVLTGDGGDEVFGGYWSYGQYSKFPPFDFRSLSGFLQSIRLRRMGLKCWQDLHENITHFSILEPKVRRILSQDHRMEDGYWHFREHNSLGPDVFRRSQWVDIKTYLPGSVLEKVDRCTMAHSLEARPPFLGRKLVETILSLPVEQTNPRGEYKSLLRTAYRGRIRNGILDATKTGFAGPDQLWSDLPNQGIFKDSIQHLFELGFLSPEAGKIAGDDFRVAWRLALVSQCIRAGYFCGLN